MLKIILTTVFLTVVAIPQTPPVLKIEFERLDDGIYLAYRPGVLEYWVEGNSLIVINEQDVVVVDSGGTVTTAKSVIAKIKSLTKNPVSVVINTHGHGDHSIGNQEYVRQYPSVEIIAHEKTREYIAGNGYNYVDSIAKSVASRKVNGEKEIARLIAEDPKRNREIIANLKNYYRKDIDIRQVEYAKVKRTPPTKIVNEALTLKRGLRTIKIMHLGAGDTPGDLVVYLPKEKIICTGDMVTQPVPFGYSRHPLEWKETLGKVAELDFERLVPGHGKVQGGKAYIRDVQKMLEAVQKKIRVGISRGKKLEEIRKSIDMSKYSKRFAGADPVNVYYFREYFVNPNITRTYNKLIEKRDKKQ